MINVSESGLLTIAGGKWTTYRAMAQDAIDRAIEIFGKNEFFLKQEQFFCFFLFF